MSISRITQHARRLPRLVLGIVLGLASSAALADWGVTFQRPVTPMGQRILELHNLILLICFVIFVLVFGVMFYSVAMHRKSRGAKPARFHDNTKLEIVWTVIPFLILVGMAVPSAATFLQMSDVSKSEMTVKITGYQWKWRYDYPDQDIGFFSSLSTPRDQIENKSKKDENYLLEVDNPLVLPVGKKIRFIVTANDVIHSWWVPQLGVKKDAIPGYINETWAYIEEPGTYRGQCTELCGKDHGFMPIVVQAVSQEDFDKWVSQQKAQAVATQAASNQTLSKDELMAHGKQIFSTTCAACHGPEGKGMPGVFPALVGSKVVAGPVEDHLKTVLQGRHTGKYSAQMPAFASQLSDFDIAGVVTYERSTFGKGGEVVQAAQVKALR